MIHKSMYSIVLSRRSTDLDGKPSPKEDLFHTLVECQWRYTLPLFFLCHVLSWLAFGALWYLVSAAHGDLPDQEREGALPCVTNLTDFTACFLYSMESQTTIGYGTGYPSANECPEALFLLFAQMVVGLLIEALSVGVVFTKVTSPHLRAQTILFSRHVTIALSDGRLALHFRVADLRHKSLLANASISVHLRWADSNTGDFFEMNERKLDVTFDGSNRLLHLIWPTTVVHHINPSSPLFEWSPQDFRQMNFEILVFLEGSTQGTGQTFQVKTSYSQHNVLWGHKLVPMIRYDKGSRLYVADYDRFHETTPVSTPRCSAFLLNQFQTAISLPNHQQPQSAPPTTSPRSPWNPTRPGATNEHHDQTR